METQSSDYATRLEQVAERFLGQPEIAYWANHWPNTQERTAILFTICMMQHDTEKHQPEIKEKLYSWMKEIFTDTEDKQKSIACVVFLEEIPVHSLG